MIKVNNLSVQYGSKMAIRDVSLSFEPGKVTVLLGANGSGKTTLLKAVLGLVAPCEGQIFYDEIELSQMKRKEIAKKAAFLTQSRNLSSIQSLRMVLHGRFPYLSYPRHYSKNDYKLARRAMETTDSIAYENRNISELSGGQRQSVYLAMALAQDTQTIFMDEPTTYLDIRHQMQIMETARSLANMGKAVVLVLHDVGLALKEADRIALFEDGKMLCCDLPEHIYEKGLLNQVFDIEVHKMQTPHGIQYYFLSKE